VQQRFLITILYTEVIHGFQNAIFLLRRNPQTFLKQLGKTGICLITPVIVRSAQTGNMIVDRP
jgi:hypothetical protein